MKKVTLILALAMTATSLFAQKGKGSDGAFSQGSSTVSLGYGFGNIWKTLLSLGGESVSATGPLALTYEYGVAEHISAGISLGYSQIKGTVGSYEEKLTNFSAVARGNYHFGSSEKFDPYIGLGLGYYNFKWTDNSTGGNSVASFSIPGAFGFSAQLGAKYFFTPKFGAYAEIGYVAGSIAQLGVTAKF